MKQQGLFNWYIGNAIIARDPVQVFNLTWTVLLLAGQKSRLWCCFPLNVKRPDENRSHETR